MKNLFLFYVIIQSLTITSLFCAKTSGIIQIPLFNYINLKLILGEGGKTKTVPLNLKHNHTNLRLKEFPDDQRPQQLENLSKHYHDTTSRIFLSQNETFPLDHIFIDDSGSNGIGFPHLFRDYNYSFLHRLKQSGKIPRTTITFRLFRGEPDKGSIYLGGTPESIIDKQMKRITITPLPDITNWSFQAEYLKVGNNTYPLDKTIHFGIENGSNIVNLQIYNWLKEVLFKEYLKNRKCKERFWEEEEGANIVCDKDIIETLPTFDVVLNQGNIISVKIALRDDEKFLNIAYNKGVHKNNRIYLQRGLFYGNLVEFDYDKNAIVVYSENIELHGSNNNMSNNAEKNIHIKKVIFTINIFIFIICGIYLSINVKKLHKGIH